MTGPPRRTLVVDENLSKRLSTELERRGRDAKSIAELDLRGAEDPEVLRRLDEKLDGWVLVTADDSLPGDHPESVATMRGAIAVVAPLPRHESGWELEDARREVVHRWAHVMHEQAPRTVRRYGLRRHTVWRTRHRAPSASPANDG